MTMKMEQRNGRTFLFSAENAAMDARGRSPGSEGAACSLLPAASPSPARRLSGCSKQRAFAHSGGTAPDFHRTSLLGPKWAPRASGTVSRSAPRSPATRTRSCHRAVAVGANLGAAFFARHNSFIHLSLPRLPAPKAGALPGCATPGLESLRILLPSEIGVSDLPGIPLLRELR